LIGAAEIVWESSNCTGRLNTLAFNSNEHLEFSAIHSNLLTGSTPGLLQAFAHRSADLIRRALAPAAGLGAALLESILFYFFSNIESLSIVTACDFRVNPWNHILVQRRANASSGVRDTSPPD
jgi:hypothetical protein